MLNLVVSEVTTMLYKVKDWDEIQFNLFMKLQLQITLHHRVSDGVCMGYTKTTNLINVLNNSCYPSEGNNPSFGDV
jgi:hypothetical protein